MFLFLRNLKLGVFPSVVGAVSFMFSGIFVGGVWGGGVTIVSSMTWIPLAFLFSEKAVKGKSLYYGVLSGIPLALSFLGGHTQYFFLTVLALTLFYAHDFILEYKEKRRLFLTFGASLLFFFLLSAVQLLPSIELTKYSTRSSGLSFEEAVSYSFPPNQLISFLLPEFYGSGFDRSYWGAWDFELNYVYVGVVPLLFAFIAVMYSSRDRYVSFFAFLGFLSIFLAFGGYNPFYRVALPLLPFLKAFRAPARYLLLATFSLSVLSAFGVNVVFSIKDNAYAGRLRFLSKKIFCGGIVLFVLSVALLSFTISLNSDAIPSFVDDYLKVKYNAKHPAEWYVKRSVERFSGVSFNAFKWIPRNLASFSFVLVLCSWGFARFFEGRLPAEKFRVFVLLVIIGDMWFYGLKYVDVKDPAEVFRETDAVKLIKDDHSIFRVLAMQRKMSGYHIPTLKPNFGALFGVEMIDGYDPIQLSYYRKFLEAGNTVSHQPAFIRVTEIIHPVFLSLLNTKYVLSPHELNFPEFKLLDADSVLGPFGENVSVFVYENKDVLPRAFIVRNAKVVERNKILDEMKGGEFNPRDYILLEENPNVKLSNQGGFQETEIISRTPNEISVQTNLQSPGFLVLSEVWYPAWRVYDNGIEAKVLRADYVLRAVYLEAGEHTVVFKYDSTSFKVGALISTASIILLLIVWLKRR